MARSQALQQRMLHTLAACLAFVAVLAGRTCGQDVQWALPNPGPGIAQISDMELAIAESGQQQPARYDEPPPPPFDYWQPTWMPCQSLRTNRSLVLGHLWFGMDMMGWAAKGVHAPALVTTSPFGTPIGQTGVLGGNTSVLFGDKTLHKEMRPGGRITIGWWFDPNQYRGIEWHYFELDGHDLDFRAGSATGNALVARPIFNADTGLNESIPVSFPGVQGGTIDVTSVTQL